MNVTFLIGNGFDINLGLDTRYSDFYPYFIKNASSDNMIRNWISKDIELWRPRRKIGWGSIPS